MTASPPETAIAGDLSRQLAEFAAAIEYQHLPEVRGDRRQEDAPRLHRGDPRGQRRRTCGSPGRRTSSGEVAAASMATVLGCGVSGTGDRSRVRQRRDGALA